MEEERKCCGGLGLFGKCGRGQRKGCTGAHCRCMEKDCPNMHYIDCYEHYIHVEYVPNVASELLKNIFSPTYYEEEI